jgi:hypothetical protein
VCKPLRISFPLPILPSSPPPLSPFPLQYGIRELVEDVGLLANGAPSRLQQRISAQPRLGKSLIEAYRRSLASPSCLFRSRRPYEPGAQGGSRGLPLSLLLLSQRFAYRAEDDDSKVGETLVTLALRLVAQECAERTGYHPEERAEALRR